MPFAATAALSSVIPVPAEGGIYFGALGMAALFGLLVTLAFALLPLGRARDVPATALFREMGFEASGLPRTDLCRRRARARASLLALLAIWFSGDRRIASIFVGAVVFSFIVLRSVGQLVQFLARKSPRVRSVALRLAIGNIHRPGALTPSVVLSLGLGLTLLGHAGADRRQSAPADRRQPAGARAEFLLRRHPEHGGREFRGLHRQGGAGRQADARADAQRPHRRTQRRRCAESECAGGRRLGAARRPRPDL